eukprot:6308677-Amphidinium_carterae.1
MSYLQSPVVIPFFYRLQSHLKESSSVPINEVVPSNQDLSSRSDNIAETQNYLKRAIRVVACAMTRLPVVFKAFVALGVPKAFQRINAGVVSSFRTPITRHKIGGTNC